jgi:hypothetical protein
MEQAFGQEQGGLAVRVRLGGGCGGENTVTLF